MTPGDDATAEVKVRNTGDLVDEFTFEVLGEAAPWITVIPPSLNLYPGTEGSVELQMRPPRHCSTRAGVMPMTLRIASREDPEHSIVGEGGLEVGAFDELTADLAPRTAASKRSAAVFRLTVSNGGNTRSHTTVAASDPDELLAFDVVPAVLAIDPCQQASAEVRVRPRKAKLKGRAEPRPFKVVVAGAGAVPAAVSLDATLVQQPLLSWWQLLLLAVLAILVITVLKDKNFWPVLILAAAVLLIVPRSRHAILGLLGRPQPPPR